MDKNEDKNDFNSTIIPMNYKFSKKVSALKTMLKVMTGHLEIFMFGEWRVVRNIQQTSVQKMCLKTRGMVIQV